MLKYYAKTDIGLHRSCNQDSYITITNNFGDFLALVCDGIGGGKAGDVASGEFVSYFERIFKDSGPFTSLEMAKEYITYYLRMANRHVYELSLTSKSLYGMGTTVTGILITSFGTLSINLGDSRVYGVLDKRLFRLTNDHTLVNQMLMNGEITYEESINHPKKHFLVKAAGVFEEIDFDVHKVKDMKYYLICSDGLCGYVKDDELLNIVDSYEYDTCRQKCDELVNLALLKGGYDNITVVVVEP
ncbi:MAG: protein phosphatase 2C domain-containing protein [Erysipelotrichaceae bacterium]|nr:protein phosphatase 2C domain-containing protein [Erysipelotrichaceae bacterium]